jgi:hypothetical protein
MHFTLIRLMEGNLESLLLQEKNMEDYLSWHAKYSNHQILLVLIGTTDDQNILCSLHRFKDFSIFMFCPL